MRVRAAWAVPAAVAAVVRAAIGGVVAWKEGSASAAAPAAVTVATATVIRTQLSTTQTLSGTLGYGTAQTLNGTKPGIVTWLPVQVTFAGQTRPQDPPHRRGPDPVEAWHRRRPRAPGPRP
jgi:hypothetical protein